MLGRWRLGLQPIRPDVLVLEGSVNDLRFGAGVATPAIANLRELVLEAEQSGSHVIVVTVLPFEGASGWTPGAEREREAINTALLELCSRQSHVACVDAGTIMARGAKLAPAYDTGDSIHLSQQGQRHLAELVADHVTKITAPRAR